jgi:hypothetical protein
LSSLLI